MVVPATQGALAGTYTATTSYTPTGDIRTTSMSPAGGLPAETLTYTYNTHGLPTSMVGTNQYVNSVVYNPYGIASQISGRKNNSLITSFNLNPETLTLDQTALHGHTTRPMIERTSYTRDKADRITRSVTDMNYNQPATQRTQCYAYDAYERISDAWTATDNCATKPTDTAHTQVGGPVPMWTSWTYNTVGARTSQTTHPTRTTPTIGHTTTYQIGLPGHPHATQSSTTTTRATTTTTTNSYDAAGNTTSRRTGNLTETLTWNAQGRATSITQGTKRTSYIYSADGDILARTDPTGTTIYTPIGELHQQGTTVTADRYYDFDGRTIAHRTTNGGQKLYALHTDPHGTAELAVDWNDLSQVTWRFLDPYGNRLNGIGTWPSDHTYLNLPTEATSGLIQTGQRLYDPVQGRFLSPDPVLGPGTPQSLNSYSYTFGDPINTADPTGQWPNWGQVWQGIKNFAGGAANYVVDTALDLGQGIGTVATYVATRDWNRSVRINRNWTNHARAGYAAFENRLGINRNSIAYKAGYATAMIADIALSGGAGLARASAKLATKTFTNTLRTTFTKLTRKTFTHTTLRQATKTTTYKAGAGLTKAIGSKPSARNTSSSLELGKGRMATVRETGNIGELIAGIDKNTKHIDSATRSVKYRIPDELNDQVIGEVKNVTRLGYTKQLQDYVAHATKYGLRFNLYVRESTTLSKPLHNLIDDGTINLLRVLGS